MGLEKIFGFLKKGSKAASKQKGKKGEVSRFSWPSGIRVGIYGHDNSGKTVYLTVLNEECKISQNLQISITDNATAAEFLSNYRQLWGLGTSSQTGTVVDLKGEKKFPDQTRGDKVLLFNAILDRSKKLAVVAYDYNGKAIGISGIHELTDKVVDFMTGCDGILFFFDPKILGAELETQAHAASFINMLERLVPLRSRLPIPIALVVNKADILPGFAGDNQTILVSAEDEHLLAEDFDFFLEKILSSNKIAANSQWAGSVRNVLVKLRDFLRVVVGRTLNFQIFFISNTGNPPEKVGTDVGRSIYAPPAKIHPIGVREPFYWLLTSIISNRRLSRFRKVAKFVSLVSLVWIIVWSIPFLIHFGLIFSGPINTEDRILKAYGGNHFNTTEAERKDIMRGYYNYQYNWLVKWVFNDFKLPARKIHQAYNDFDAGKAIGRLDNLNTEFANIVKDSTVWPKINPKNDSLVLKDRHQRLLAALNELHMGDESSTPFIRSGRTLAYWDLFGKYLAGRSDTLTATAITKQVNYDRASGATLSSAENKLMDAMLGIAVIKRIEVAQQVEATQAISEFEPLQEEINGSTDPSFVLGKAVEKLQNIKTKLDQAVDAEKLKKIEAYLKEVEKWQKSRKFTYRIETIPNNGHLHIEVIDNGQNPKWADSTQLFQGDELQMTWKLDDDIYMAFDTLNAKEDWGRNAVDKLPLRDRYALFQMEGNVVFPNAGKTVIISFNPSLKDQLPKLK